MRSFLLAAATLALALSAGRAAAEVRICEATLRGPAGEHTVTLRLEDGVFVEGEAAWAPPRQNARANVEFPRLELRYEVLDFETGARSPLRYLMVIHAVRPTLTRARTAQVALGPYAGEVERREWGFFAQVRDPANRGMRNSDAIAGEIPFSSRASLEAAQTAAQMETYVLTDLNERLVDGVFNLTARPALDALLDRAFQTARQAANNPRRDCRELRHHERDRQRRR